MDLSRKLRGRDISDSFAAFDWKGTKQNMFRFLVILEEDKTEQPYRQTLVILMFRQRRCGEKSKAAALTRPCMW